MSPNHDVQEVSYRNATAVWMRLAIGGSRAKNQNLPSRHGALAWP